MGSMKSVKQILSRSWIQELDAKKEVWQWSKEKFSQRADDAWRSKEWRRSGNTLTDSIVPGVLLQGAASFSQIEENGEQGIFELKVDVLFGRAYTGALLINNRFPCITWAFRGSNEEMTMPYNREAPGHAFHSALEFGSAEWVFREGHMP